MSTDAPAKDGPQVTGASAQECQRLVDYALAHNPVVKFMVEKLEEVIWLHFYPHNVQSVR